MPMQAELICERYLKNDFGWSCGRASYRTDVWCGSSWRCCKRQNRAHTAVTVTSVPIESPEFPKIALWGNNGKQLKQHLFMKFSVRLPLSEADLNYLHYLFVEATHIIRMDLDLSSHTQCEMCRQFFSVMARRHHCRDCGKAICGTHAQEVNYTWQGHKLLYCLDCIRISQS